MRVLFISGGDAKYGAPRSMIEMMKGLKEKYNIEAVLLTKKRNILNEYCDQNGIENYSFWYRDIMAGSPYTNHFLTICKHLVKYLAFLLGGITMRNIKKLPLDFATIDIVHSNTNRQDIGAYIALQYHIKHIWHIREMGREDYNVIFYKKDCIKYMNQNADAFIYISNTVRDKWKGIGLSCGKDYVIYNGIATEEIVASGEENKRNKIRIVMTGHIQPNKGQLQLIEAIVRLPLEIRNKIEVDLIGEAYSDYKKQLEQIIKEKDMEKQIHFLGYRSDVNSILYQYDIGLTCSKAEGFGRCTVEYMMAGLMTIASDAGANPEIIEDKVTGLLYRYNNIDNLANVLKWGVEHDKERKEIADNGKKMARNKFSKEHCADNIYEVYQNV